MWWIILAMIIFVIGMIIYAAGINGSTDAVVFGIILTIISCLFYTIGLISIFTGYPVNEFSLPVYEVCEVISVTPSNENDNGWVTLLKLPDGQFRLFELYGDKPEIGTIKVQGNRTLKPFPAPVQLAPETKSAEANSP